MALLPQKNGESFYSPIFFAKSNEKIRWRLKICPRGAYKDSEDYLSLYLERVLSEDDAPVSVESEWAVFTNFDKEIFSKSSVKKTLGFPPLSSHFGWDKVVEVDSVIDPSDFTKQIHAMLKIQCKLVYAI